MSISNIHVLINNPVTITSSQVQRAMEAAAALLAADHRKGKHTYGNMRRDCPLCQSGR